MPAYTIFLYTEEPNYVQTWFEKNEDELAVFSKWMENYEWK
ncbi:MAG: hypothetical protein ACI97N_000445 [Cognaticolwellia sp.]|jgi:hypothetical protein|tara:strand:+ start:649 stop:771 length:123 start_codon:yes stop_codon:yes gene_type:complete